MLNNWNYVNFVPLTCSNADKYQITLTINLSETVFFQISLDYLRKRLHNNHVN